MTWEQTYFFSEIQKLNKLECWSVIAGEGTGSHASLDFGKKIMRDRPLSNPNLSEDSKKYAGEYSILLEECSWTVESQEGVVCGSESPNHNDGEMVNGLKKLLGGRVYDIKLSRPSLDLHIEFDNGLTLKLFCITIASEEDGDNYTVFTPTHIFTIKGRGTIDIEGQ